MAIPAVIYADSGAGGEVDEVEGALRLTAPRMRGCRSATEPTYPRSPMEATFSWVGKPQWTRRVESPGSSPRRSSRGLASVEPPDAKTAFSEVANGSTDVLSSLRGATSSARRPTQPEAPVIKTLLYGVLTVRQ